MSKKDNSTKVLSHKKACALHKRLCLELGIPPTKIKILKQNPKNKNAYATYRIRSRTIVLWEAVILKGGGDWRETIAHETYHHYQLVKGWLKWRTWKGKPRSSFPGYRSTPWEKGAFRFARKMRETNFKLPKNKKP